MTFSQLSNNRRHNAQGQAAGTNKLWIFGTLTPQMHLSNTLFLCKLAATLAPNPFSHGKKATMGNLKHPLGIACEATLSLKWQGLS